MNHKSLNKNQKLKGLEKLSLSTLLHNGVNLELHQKIAYVIQKFHKILFPNLPIPHILKIVRDITAEYVMLF